MESVGRSNFTAVGAVFGVVVTVAVLGTKLFRIEFLMMREKLFRDAPFVPRRAGLDPFISVVATVAVCLLRLALDHARRRRDVVVRAPLDLFISHNTYISNL